MKARHKVISIKVPSPAVTRIYIDFLPSTKAGRLTVSNKMTNILDSSLELCREAEYSQSQNMFTGQDIEPLRRFGLLAPLISVAASVPLLRMVSTQANDVEALVSN